MVVVKSEAELATIVTNAPANFGTDTLHRYNVVFVREPLAATEVLALVTPKDGVDQATVGPGVLYFSTLLAQATKSALPKMIGTPLYKQVTIRNWNTTTKLLALTKQLHE